MKEIKLEQTAQIGGVIQCAVIDAGTGRVVKEYPPQKNLVLDSGLDYFFVDDTQLGIDDIDWAFAGTGTTPVKVEFTGTFEQTLTTVTRSSGTDVFAAGDVGKRLAFADGKRGKITSFTNTTEVEVDTSQTAAAQVMTVYNTDQLALATPEDSTVTQDTAAEFKSQTLPTGSNAVTEKKTWVFDVRVGNVSHTEIGFGKSGGADLFSRILLAAPIAVNIGQQLRVSYSVTMTDTHGIVAVADTLAITGWPRPYNILSIVSAGATFDITFEEDHHYIVGGKVNVDTALPTKFTITDIASTGSNFTVTTSADHGMIAADSIDIEDCTVAAYNGTWTVASSASTTTFVVTSGANPGAASDGTARKSVPGTWYDGEWTIASIPTTDSVQITSGIDPIDAGNSGTAYNNLDCDIIHPHHGFRGEQSNGGSNGNGNYLFEGDKIRVGINRSGNELAFSGFPQTSSMATDYTSEEADNTSVKDSGGDGITNDAEIGISDANYDDITQMMIAVTTGTGTTASIIVNFDEVQRKDTGYTLTITLFRKLSAELA